MADDKADQATGPRSPQTVREDALAVYAEACRVRDTWASRARDHGVELAKLEATAGEVALQNIRAVSALPKKLTSLRDQLGMAEKAAVAAGPHVESARRAVLLAEADEWDLEVVKRQEALDEHQARTAQLVSALLEHEGRFISLQEAEARISMEPGSAGLFIAGAPVLKSRPLQWAVAVARLKAEILRWFAAGRTPRAVNLMGQLTEVTGYGNRSLGPDDWPESLYELGLVARQVSPYDQAKASLSETQRIVDEAQARVDQLKAEADAADAQGGYVAEFHDRSLLVDAEKALTLAIRNRDNAARATSSCSLSVA